MNNTDQGFSSSEYWDARYERGGNSGAGSQGILANYKTSFISNAFLRYQVSFVIDYGCGDGRQLQQLHCSQYMGVDVSPTAIEKCRARYKNRRHWRFCTVDNLDDLALPYDAALSLDVIYHLIEDWTFEAHMRALFNSATKVVIIYSSDWEAQANVEHIRHRWFSSWIALNAPHWTIAERHANPYPYRQHDELNTTFASFVVCCPVQTPHLSG